MVYDAVKLPMQGSSTIYGALKDGVIYLRDRAKYIRRMGDNLGQLSALMGKLYSRKEQIDRALEMSVSKEATGEYHILVQTIKDAEIKWNKFLSNYHQHVANAPSSLQNLDASSVNRVIEAVQMKNPSAWTPKFWKRATLGRRIVRLRNHVSEVIKGIDVKHMMMETRQTNHVTHASIYDLPQLNQHVDKIWSYLLRPNVQKVSIVGPVGVGKTTILTKLKIKLIDDAPTRIVIWINYPKDLPSKEIVGMMQKEIMIQLKIHGEKTESIEENASLISKFLLKKKYTILIDGVSSNINLAGIGIHEDHKDGKVVVAARNSRDIKQMRTDEEVEVGKLSKEDSWRLFETICGAIRDKRIRDIAEMIIECCGGLPLVVVMLANYLKGETDEDLWNGVKNKLKSDSNANTLGLADVGNAYQIMYERLDEDAKKMCSLYAALFPCEQKICKEYMIECWLSEGFFNQYVYIGNLRSGRQEGVVVMNELTNRFLLEACEEGRGSDGYVKMPIHFRTLALAITYPGDWNASRRVSLVGKLPPEPNAEEMSESASEVSHLKGRAKRNMSTLLLQRDPEIQKLEDCFSEEWKNLQVLDLCQARVLSLPSSISHLKNLVSLYLNGCKQLSSLPSELETLIMLEILDIRTTAINPWLPQQIGSMVNLRCLRASFDHQGLNRGHKGKGVMTVTPADILSRLLRLEELVVETAKCTKEWIDVSGGIVDVLVNMEHLTTLHFNFPSVQSLQKFIKCSRSWNNKGTEWGRSTFRSFKFFIGSQQVSDLFCSDIAGISAARHLRLISTGEESSSIDLEALEQTSTFELIGHSSAKSLGEFNFARMQTLKICLIGDCYSAESIVDVTKGHTGENNSHCILESLEKLILFNLPSLKHIWKGEFLSQSFSSLIVLKVYKCPELSEITVAIWSLLKEIVIIECGNLKKLSMTHQNAPNLVSIVCEKTWWDNTVELLDEDRNHFTPMCRFVEQNDDQGVTNCLVDGGERTAKESMLIEGRKDAIVSTYEEGSGSVHVDDKRGAQTDNTWTEIQQVCSTSKKPLEVQLNGERVYDTEGLRLASNNGIYIN